MSDARSQQRDSKKALRQQQRLQHDGRTQLLTAHRGDTGDKLDVMHRSLRLLGHEQAAGALSRQGTKIAEQLHLYACAEWHLKDIWAAKRGDSKDGERQVGRDVARGVDGLTLGSIERQYVADGGTVEECRWNGCRGLRDSVLAALNNTPGDNAYRPLPYRKIEVPKDDGTTRPISIPAVGDWLVEKAVKTVIQPILYGDLPDTVVGFRPGVGHLQALALAITLADRHGLYRWLVTDVKNAFGTVPLQPLLEVLAKKLHNEKLVNLIELLINPTRTGADLQAARGIPQGSPISPVLLNALLGEYLDIPWQKQFPQWPLLRYADDIVILTANRRDARTAHRELAKLLAVLGMQLADQTTGKNKTHNSDVRNKLVTWLGHGIQRKENGFAVSIPAKAHRRLQEIINPNDRKEDSTRTARQEALQGWVAYHGPALHDAQTVNELTASIAALAVEAERPIDQHDMEALRKRASTGNRQWQDILSRSSNRSHKGETEHEPKETPATVEEMETDKPVAAPTGKIASTHNRGMGAHPTRTAQANPASLEPQAKPKPVAALTQLPPTATPTTHVHSSAAHTRSSRKPASLIGVQRLRAAPRTRTRDRKMWRKPHSASDLVKVNTAQNVSGSDSAVSAGWRRGRIAPMRRTATAGASAPRTHDQQERSYAQVGSAGRPARRASLPITSHRRYRQSLGPLWASGTITAGAAPSGRPRAPPWLYPLRSSTIPSSPTSLPAKLSPH